MIDTVRKLATDIDIIEMADVIIGKLLAYYPETSNDYWPPDEITNVIERINTKNLKNNFSMTLTNKRGFTFRSHFEGGAIERSNVAHFQKLSDLHKFKHSKISTNYLLDAKHEDDQAERDRLEY